MNIAVCYESVFPSRGGLETYIADLLRRLARDRHEVHLYGYQRDVDALPRSIVFHAILQKAAPRFLRPWRFAAACEYALRRERHDVILGFNKTWHQDVILPGGGLHVATADHNVKKYRRPFARVLARLGRWFSLSYWSFCWLEKKQYASRWKPIIIAPSRMVQQHFEQYYGIGPERIRIIPNAIDPERFIDRDRLKLRAEVRDRHGIEADETVGLFVGHNYRLKGLGPLMHAVAEMTPARFRLLVCGSARTGRWQRLARRLGVEDKVCFAGFQKEMRGHYFAADFLVHPTFYDPGSLVVMEALACGMPVITTRYNGAGELLHPPRDGFVLDDPHDHATLARCLECWCDRSILSAASQAARETAVAWTFEHHYRALLGVLQDAARQRLAA